jgi:hypothetical protein
MLAAYDDLIIATSFIRFGTRSVDYRSTPLQSLFRFNTPRILAMRSLV